MTRALVALVLLGGAAAASPLHGTLALPELPRIEAPRAHWRVENGLLPVPARAGDPREAVIVFEPAQKPKKTDDAPAVTVELHGLRLDPRVVAVPLGGTVQFKNSDRVPHTLFVDKGESVMGPATTPSGQTRAARFLVAGEFHLLDAEFPHVWGVVVAVDAPYVAQPDDKGAWKIDLPDGKYTARVYYRSGWVLTRPVEVHGPAELSLRVSDKGP